MSGTTVVVVGMKEQRRGIDQMESAKYGTAENCVTTMNILTRHLHGITARMRTFPDTVAFDGLNDDLQDFHAKLCAMTCQEQAIRSVLLGPCSSGVRAFCETCFRGAHEVAQFVADVMAREVSDVRDPAAAMAALDALAAKTSLPGGVSVDDWMANTQALRVSGDASVADARDAVAAFARTMCEAVSSLCRTPLSVREFTIDGEIQGISDMDAIWSEVVDAVAIASPLVAITTTP